MVGTLLPRAPHMLDEVTDQKDPVPMTQVARGYETPHSSVNMFIWSCPPCPPEKFQIAYLSMRVPMRIPGTPVIGIPELALVALNFNLAVVA